MTIKTQICIPITKPKFDEDEVQAVREVLDSGWVTQGPVTKRFENLIADRHQVAYALATTSCTAALHLATMALKLGPGDEVVVPAFTWVTSAHCVEYVGAKVVFADVDPKTFNIDPIAMEAAITPRTRAIVVVHLFGLAAPMDEIMKIAKRHGVAVIEDAACAIGSTYKGVPVGGIGTLGCFSFHPRKVITTGEGGMVTTNDEQLSTFVNSLRNHGCTGLPAEDPTGKHPYTMGEFDLLGYNLRLSDIQASIGVAQVNKLTTLLAERRSRALRYIDLLSDIKDLALPNVGHTDGHTYQSFVIRVLEGGRDRRNSTMDLMATKGIQTRPGTHAVHNLTYYRDKYDLHAANFPNALICEYTSITLPIFPNITDKQQDEVVFALRLGLKLKRHA